MTVRFVATSLAGLVLAVLFAAGCEMTIDADVPEHEPRLAVNGSFAPGEPWQVQLSHSVGAFGSDYPGPVSGATVEVVDEAGSVRSLQPDTLPGIYRYEGMLPQAGRRYTLRASAPGFDPVEASDVAPPPVDVALVDTTLRVQETVHGSGYVDRYGERTFRLRLADSPGERNFYQLTVTASDTLRYRTFHRVHGDTLVEDVRIGQRIYFNSRDLSVINESGEETHREDNEIWVGEAYFRDDLFDGKAREISITVQEKDYYGGDEDIRRTYYLRLAHVSRALYEHLRRRDLQYFTEDNPFAEPVNVSSNVQNGYGIFAGYNVQVMEVRTTIDGSYWSFD